MTRYGHIFMDSVGRNGRERPDAEQRYNSTLSLTSALDCGWWANVTSWVLYVRERDPVPTVQEAGRAAGLVCDGVENLASHWGSITVPSSP